MHETFVTCHECYAQSVLHTVHWPPQLFVCSECNSYFFLSGFSMTNEPLFQAHGYCRINQ